jgi:hypothetical protein
MVIGLALKLEKDGDPVYMPTMVKCKSLARSIKKARIPSVYPIDIGTAIPPRQTAKRLLDAYFRTFETVYRILHVPAFWDQYERYWENPAAASQAFIVQMQLCMAIGACFQDDVVALRPSATQWIYEAQFWLAPPEKSRMSFAALQIRCLLHLASKVCGVGGDLAWVSSGSLMRCAMYMGLHRDPDHLPTMPRLRAELRRRLWATILEIVLQSSLDSGGPPLISTSDYDTKHPGNFDDEQLSDTDGTATSVPRPSKSFTQTSVQLSLLRSFKARLAVAQYVNGFHTTATYEETSRLNSELHNASASLQYCKFKYDPAGILPKRISLFQHRLAEHMVYRFFLSLNSPWLDDAKDNPEYYFARKLCVDTSRKLFEGFAETIPPSASDPADHDFVRLSTAGSGAFRSVPIQCMLNLGLELYWQALEHRISMTSSSMDVDSPVDAPAHEVNGAVPVTSPGGPQKELKDALDTFITLAKRRIMWGETNVKGYLFHVALKTMIEALERGASESELENEILESWRAGLQQCLSLLQETAGEQTSPVGQAEQAAENGMGSWDSPMDGEFMPELYGFGGGWDLGDMVFSF